MPELILCLPGLKIQTWGTLVVGIDALRRAKSGSFHYAYPIAHQCATGPPTRSVQDDNPVG